MLTLTPVPYRFKEFWPFPRFSYYSIVADGDDQTIASKTLEELVKDEAMRPLVQRFTQMMKQLGQRCNNVHARGILRGERAARALPPEAWAMKSRGNGYLYEFGDLSPIPALRWYSYDASYNVLLLYGLGYKIDDDPEKCPNVKGLFKFAVHASRYLNTHEGDWTVNGLHIALTDEDCPLEL